MPFSKSHRLLSRIVKAAEDTHGDLEIGAVNQDSTTPVLDDEAAVAVIRGKNGERWKVRVSRYA